LHHDPAGRPYARPGEMAGRIVAAAAESGIGLTLLPAFYAQGGFGGAPPSAAQRRFLCTVDNFAKLLEETAAALAALPDATIGVAPHSLRAVTPKALAQVTALAAGRPVHIHVAEQRREVEECLAWSGTRPVEWLLDHAEVNATWCIVHATHMTEQETARLARTGAVAGLCPITEASLGDGIFNGPGWLAAGGSYGIGTDSNVRIGAAAELAALEYAQRLSTEARNVLASGAGRATGRSLFDAAREGGARAMASGQAAIAFGRPADLLALDTKGMSLALRGEDGWLDGWIFAADRAIDTVWRRGRPVVRHGRHIARESIERRYLASLRRLMAA
ncbi:MAG: formimidoylglutamate deiminase, partial [Acetobacteraceae bacterium]